MPDSTLVTLSPAPDARPQLQAALYRISEAAHAAPSLEALYPLIHGIVSELMPAENFFIAVCDEDGDLLRFPYFVDSFDARPAPRKRGRGLTEYVIRTGKALLAPGEVMLQLAAKGEAELVGSPAFDWLGVPLRTAAGTIGALVVQSYTPGVDFDESHRDILSFVSDQIAMAIQRKRSQDAQRLALQKFQTLAALAPVGIFSTDPAGRFTWVNDLWCRLSGLTPDAATGEGWSAALPAEDREAAVREFRAAVRAGRDLAAEHRIVSAQGERLWVALRAIPLRSDEGVLTGYLGTMQDVTERKLAEEQLAHRATHDPLTGLPNRMLFEDRLRLAMIHAQRQRQGVAVLFVDLDGFKKVNDARGHAVGDVLLKRVAERLVRSVRSGDTVSRLGGDEFTVLLVNVSRLEDASSAVHKVLLALREPFDDEGEEIPISASIGVSLFPKDADSPEELVRLADAAMYRAKELGRDTFQFYAVAPSVE